LIQKAKSTDKSKIACHIFYIPEYSESEIAIRKVAIRTMPTGGTCSYAELVRNANILFNMLLASSENPVVFSHGGDRRGANYTEKKESNIRILLAKRLGRSVTTINKYLNYGEFLSSEAMEALIKAEVEKEFFEAAQTYKRKIIVDLKSERKSEDEIATAVSEAVLSRLYEYQQNGKAAVNCGQSDQDENPATQNQTKKDEVSRPVSKPKAFKHWSGNDSAAEESLPTENEVYQEVKTVGSLLMQAAEDSELAVHQRIEIFYAQIVKLSQLIQQLNHLSNLQKVEKEDYR
jgi:hypothetical protein